MKIYTGVEEYRATLSTHHVASSVVTLGNFDGMHLGHQELIGRVVKSAREKSLRSIVFTFRPHPAVVLQTGRKIDFLNTYEERAEAIADLGVDILIEEPFTQELSHLPAQDFFESRLVRGASASQIYVGYDFAFGKSRSGSLDELRGMCARTGIDFETIPALEVDGSPISSTRIRSLLSKHEIRKANALLGSEFFYQGPVVQGDQRGRKIGFPTANQLMSQSPDCKLILPRGVYATITEIPYETEISVPSVTNIGVRPTFQTSNVENLTVIETHILSKGKIPLDLYGKNLKIKFVEFLRPEMKFDGVQALQTQIAKDIDRAQQILLN